MTGGVINRAAWADIVAECIAAETKGNKSRFAQLVGVNYKTILRWLSQEVEVSEESIRQVATAVHVSPLELLVRVGLYDAGDLAPPVEGQAEEGDGPLRTILEADLPPRVKARMITRLHQLRQQETQRQLDEVQWWIDQARGA